MKIIKTALILFLFLSIQIYSQTFKLDTLTYNGDIEKRINVVILGDGYLESELPDFMEHAIKFSGGFFTETPFKEFINYFNVFAISVPSNESGAALNPSNLIDNYFGSTFGAGGIDRLLVPTRSSRIQQVLAENFPLYDQVIMLVNSTKYGGSGGWVATSSVHSSASEIVIHEIGHSFANLGDEYWAGDQYARERPNMTRETDPEKVKWKNWYGNFDIGIYQHCCGGVSEQWYRPHNNCKMRSLNNPFCSVCIETISAKIHFLTNPVDSYFPADTLITVDSASIEFQLNLLKPNPNTLNIKWLLNSNELALNEERILIEPAVLDEEYNYLRAIVIDTTKYIRIDNYSTINLYIVEWEIKNMFTGVSEIFAKENKIAVNIYPNPASDKVYIRFDSAHFSKLSFELYNTAGQQLSKQNVYTDSNEYEIDLTDLPSGTYIINILENSYPIISNKLIKE